MRRKRQSSRLRLFWKAANQVNERLAFCVMAALIASILAGPNDVYGAKTSQAAQGRP
jgi:hypothetical protein